MSLGVEFWRNYVGIDKPLEFVDGDGDVHRFAEIGKLWIYGDGMGYLRDECRPILRTPESLTDEEWQFVFDAKGEVVRHRSSNLIAIYERAGGTWKTRASSYDFYKKSFQDANLCMFNRLFSLHCHPDAEEYIKNGWAIRKEE